MLFRSRRRDLPGPFGQQSQSMPGFGLAGVGLQDLSVKPLGLTPASLVVEVEGLLQPGGGGVHQRRTCEGQGWKQPREMGQCPQLLFLRRSRQALPAICTRNRAHWGIESSGPSSGSPCHGISSYRGTGAGPRPVGTTFRGVGVVLRMTRERTTGAGDRDEVPGARHPEEP